MANVFGLVIFGLLLTPDVCVCLCACFSSCVLSITPKKNNRLQNDATEMLNAHIQDPCVCMYTIYISFNSNETLAYVHILFFLSTSVRFRRISKLQRWKKLNFKCKHFLDFFLFDLILFFIHILSRFHLFPTFFFSFVVLSLILRILPAENAFVNGFEWKMSRGNVFLLFHSFFLYFDNKMNMKTNANLDCCCSCCYPKKARRQPKQRKTFAYSF